MKTPSKSVTLPSTRRGEMRNSDFALLKGMRASSELPTHSLTHSLTIGDNEGGHERFAFRII